MVIMAPNNIAFFVVLVHNISKHLICFLICLKLRLKTACGGKAVFLWKSKVVEKGPQYIVAIAIIILMNNLFIKKYRDTPLQRTIFMNYLPHFLQQNIVYARNTYGNMWHVNKSLISVCIK